MLLEEKPIIVWGDRMSIRFKSSGNFDRTERFLKNMYREKYLDQLDYWGELGVQALKNATPVDTGKTAESWDYEIIEESGKTTIQWINTNINKNVNIAVILQYGHGTNHGGYVMGVDYINPALRPIFDKIAEDAWLEVVRS